MRDGGWVNSFCFGTETMQAILRAVEESKIEYVELGYLDEKSGSAVGRSQYCDGEAIRRNLLWKGKSPQVGYLVMIDYGKYPVCKLAPRSGDTADGIRLCFHKKDAAGAVRMGQEILKKGYGLFLQPMVCTRYTDLEFRQLLLQVRENLKGLSAFYIVDSFGTMHQEDVEKRMRLADSLLEEEICLGLHTHNNLQLSFANAAAALDMKLSRDLIIDGTLLGMGKGPGNVRTEEFAEYLNKAWGKTYNLQVLKAAAEKIIGPMEREYEWGYREEYALSAKYCLTPSYAKMLFSEYGLSVGEIDELLSRIPEEKRESFDRSAMERILKEYRRERM